MNTKELFIKLHAWEFPVVLDYVIKQSLFDIIDEESSFLSIQNKYGFVKEKLEALLFVLQENGLIKISDDDIELSEFSKKYLVKDSEFYIGSYISWRISDLKHWENNLDQVLKGQSKTVHHDGQYINYTDTDKGALEGIVVACSKVYPIDEFIEVVKNKIKLEGTLLDLACGIGLWGLSLKKAFKDISPVLFDRDTSFVESHLRDKSDLLSEVKIIEGDMFTDNSLPKVDNVIVTNVFMDWEDKTVDNLIEKIVVESTPKCLLIHEFVYQEGDIVSAEYNLFANVETLGRIRDKEWWTDKLRKHFSKVEIIKLDFGSSVIVCQK